MKKLLFLLAMFVALTSRAATITSGHTYTNGELVTAQKMNDMVNNATVTAIQGSDISAGAVGSSQLSVNSVSGNNIQSQTITGGNLVNNTVTSTQIATNTIAGFNFSTNIVVPNSSVWVFSNGMFKLTGATATGDFRNAYLLLSNNQIPLAAVSNAIAGSSIISSNLNGYSYSSGGGYTWSTIMSLSTTASTGSVHVIARLMIAPSQSHTVFTRIVDSGNTVENAASFAAIGGASATPYTVDLHDFLTGSTKTYSWQVATSATATAFTNTHATAVGGASGMTNQLGMTILQMY